MKHYRGHYCWCCGRIRANEEFSGRNHSRHLCRDCTKLGKEELEYRQGVRNVDQLIAWEGRLSRKGRKAMEAFLAHSNERIRSYAQTVVAQNVEERKLYLLDSWEFECGEVYVPEFQDLNQHLSATSPTTNQYEAGEDEDSDLPF